MADTKISALTADASPTGDDLVVTVNDPAGTPANRKVTLANVAAYVAGTGTSITSLPPAAGPPDSDDGIIGVEDSVASQFTKAQILNDAVLKATYDANTILKADSDDTPVALTMGASTILSRLAAGSIVAATPAQIKTLLAIANTDVSGLGTMATETATNYVAKSLYDANTVLAATTDDTPAALTMGASTILARLAAGNIVAATPTQLKTLLAITGADVANTPAGTIAATTSQNAINELDTEKAALTGAAFTGDTTVTGAGKVTLDDAGTVATRSTAADSQPSVLQSTFGAHGVFALGPGSSTDPTTDIVFGHLATGVIGCWVGRIGSTRIQKRANVLTNSNVTAGAVASFNTDSYDVVHLTGLAQAITSWTLTGTPLEGDTLRIDITDNGTIRALAWTGTYFDTANLTTALPTTTVASTRLDVGFVWNTVTSKWRCVGVG